MALHIRLTRIGTKGKPAYRVVVAEARSRRDGAAVEQIGQYDPKSKKQTFKVDLDRVDYWIKQGAKPTDTVASLVRRARRAATASAAS
jgi:small subunit ribosomal protein S16